MIYVIYLEPILSSLAPLHYDVLLNMHVASFSADVFQYNCCACEGHIVYLHQRMAGVLLTVNLH